MVQEGSGLVAKPKSTREEANIIKAICEEDGSQLKTGAVWCVIASKWFDSWKMNSGYDEEERESVSTTSNGGADTNGQENDNVIELGAIDNSALVEREVNNGIRLKKNLTQGNNYALIPEKAWAQLLHWYSGGPTIKRNVICDGGKYFRVEVYPLVLNVKCMNDEGTILDKVEEIEISVKESVEELKKRIGERLGVDTSDEKTRLWSYLNQTTPELISGESAVEDLIDGQLVVLETKLSSGEWPTEKKKSQQPNTEANAKTNGTSGKKDKKDNKKEKKKGKSIWGKIVSVANTFINGPSPNYYYEDDYSYYHNNYSSSSSSSSSSNNVQKRGICGLNNMGNTCYLNSALQCLASTSELTNYFLTDAYKNEINEKNPLGCKGELARQFGSLLKVMWSGQHSSVHPKNVKSVIGKKSPQFNGYDQHDAQELLAALLDGLHEDLNRVPAPKPYIEFPESDGTTSDVDLATDTFNKRRMRDNSFIYDLFQGQLKSTVKCPEEKCGKVSVTFDPFLFLSLPLPLDNMRCIDVIHFRNDDMSRPVKYSVKVQKNDSIADLVRGLAAMLDCPSETLLLADITSHRIYNYLPISKPVGYVKSDDITFSFEVPKESGIRLHCMHRKPLPEPPASSFKSPYALFGLPLAYWCPANVTNEQLYTLLYNRIKRYLRLPESGEDIPIPFKLKLVNHTGLECSKCSILSSCFGCELPRNNSPLHLKSASSIAMEWTKESYELYYDTKLAESVLRHPSCKANEEKMNAKLTIYSCLDLYIQNERLGPNDTWYCPSCKDHRRAWKKLDIWKLPKVLVVHLKRFQYTKYSREKIHAMVDYPLTDLDLSKYVCEPCSTNRNPPPVYDLYAVSCHSGGLSMGHYTAYVKNGSKWYDCNDSSCRSVNESIVKTAHAYMLFYKLRTEDSEQPADDENKK